MNKRTIILVAVAVVVLLLGGMAYLLYSLNESNEQNKQMLELAEILANGFSHVRVDFYNVNGDIYFGEMTFTSASGLIPFVPESADLILGEMWNLDTK